MYAAFPFRAPVSLLDIRKFKNPTMLPLILNRPRRKHTYYIYQRTTFCSFLCLWRPLLRVRTCLSFNTALIELEL